ncbi:M23 family metallopeptidase [Desulfococcaceae bacterium HSG8]|nr:M23 family metallopeptidase [Desulfococcaceae bacterium HSG8]
MNNKVTLYISDGNASSIKRVTIPRMRAFILLLFFCACPLLLIVEIFTYNFKISSYDSRQEKLEAIVSSQLEEIDTLNEQVRTFGNKVNSLKSDLMILHRFEKQIRHMAGLVNGDDKASVLGIGGSMPEDLDTDIALTEKHNTLVREMHDQIEQFHIASASQQERLKFILGHLLEKQNILRHTPAIWPIKGFVTSGFGSRKSPFTNKKEFHKGLDIATSEGTPIAATADGTVIYSGSKGSFGKMVVIDHGYGMITRYAHLREILKKRGEDVKKGDIIGEVGNTGMSTGPHLHYEVRLNGTPVDPKKYILN